MKFTLNWLREHLEGDAPVAEILEALPRLGFPVAAVQDWSQTLSPFRVVSVQTVNPHPNADRLRVCTVWTGEETLQVVCGAPNVRPNMRTVLARPGDILPDSGAKLKKSVIRGIESHGMLCSYTELGLTGRDFGEHENGIIVLSESLEPGSLAREALGLDDVIIEIEVTPNRGDMFGVRGIARELAAAGLGTLTPSPEDLLTEEMLQELEKEEKTSEIEGAEDLKFPTFALAYMTHVKACESPDWLKKYLRAIELKPISALVDITNYLAYDLARPLHVFDADRVQGHIRLERSKGGENFEALDGKTYILPPNALVIRDDTGVISLAGLIGGHSTACTSETKNVYLECAFFEPEDVARTGQALGIHTDARVRFERGVDPTSVFQGLSEGAALIEDLCGGEEQEVLFLEEKDLNPQQLTLRLERIKQLGGLSVSLARAEEILEALGFVPVVVQNSLQVIVPPWRFDVKDEADLVEEILRLQGYEMIPSVPLPFRPESSVQTATQLRVPQGCAVLVGRGLQEVVTWSFMAPEKTAFWGGVQRPLLLQNPLSRDFSVMRPSILPNLLDLALQHQNRSLKWPGFFEVGPQYEGVTANTQRLVVTGLLPTQEIAHWRSCASADLFTVKAHLLALLDVYGLKIASLQTISEGPDWYHPGRKGTLQLGPQKLGFFGEIHPKILKEWDIQGRLVSFELFLDRLPQPASRFPQAFLPLSSYQPVPLDLAFVVEKTLAAEILLKLIRKMAGPELQHIALFDVFEDAQKMGEGKKSLAFRLFFQSLDTTLTDAFIQEKMKIICAEVTRRVGGVLRDGGNG